MGFYLNSGNEGFKRVLRSRIYVDRTGMIEYVNSVLGTNDAFLCVSRPRRFGKSMAANMLAAYYDRSCDSSELFHGLRISEKSFWTGTETYEALQLYIDIDMAGLKQALIEEVRQEFVRAVRTARCNQICIP